MAGPFIRLAINVNMRARLRKQGFGIFKIQRAMMNLDNDLIEAATLQAEAQKPGVLLAMEKLEAQEVLGVGDGRIIEIITDFFNSELGKMILDFIEKLLLSLLL